MVANPGVCDLCASDAWSTVIDSMTGRALRSDRVVLARPLQKVECGRCGLVRDGSGFDPAATAVYERDYRATLSEHVFYTPQGPMPRSRAFGDWIADLLGADRLRGMARVLEVGAGSGLLVQALAAKMPWAEVSGIELGSAAVAEAQRHGRPVRQTHPEALEPGAYDLVCSVAVLEHVPSPTQYLQSLGRLLKPGGRLVLAQPTQEVPSYDLFFVDHLWHFGAPHLTGYAAKCGFDEVARQIGHPLMPNFSIHVFRAAAPRSRSWAWSGTPARTTCAATARQVTSDMTAIDGLIGRIAHAGQPLGVFGVFEVFALTRAYSTLGSAAIACGLDDDPGSAGPGQYAFPVVAPESCAQFGVKDVLLTMNKLYYPQATARLARLGVQAYPVLS
jgi:SAM-dependent methyltransferase